MYKKSSPLKPVSSIIKKYTCHRQAKNGKPTKLILPEKPMEQESDPLQYTHMKGLDAAVAGMDSLDAALKRAENANRDTSDEAQEQCVDPSTNDASDQLQDMDEDGVSSTLHGSGQQTSSIAKAPQLRNRTRMLKKRNRLQKDLEHTIPLILPDHPLASESRGFVFASTYLDHVKERLEESKFTEFLITIARFGENRNSVTDLYHYTLEILKDYPDLCEEFLAFLLPHQAFHCGKFMEHLGLMEMLSFLQRLEVYFSKQPQQLRKIYANWARLAEMHDLTLETVRSTILPLLKGNSFLIDSFLELLPSENPPESKMTDFQQLSYVEVENEQISEEDAFERFEIPPENDDQYGGEHCRCCCHDSVSDIASANRSKHCVPCGLKFISGKAFLQTEQGLRPARIQFTGGGGNTANIKRLNSDPRKLPRSRSRRGRTSTTQVGAKAEEGKTMDTDDEVCFSNKSKSPRSQKPKMSKQGCVKSAKALSLSRSASTRKPNVSKGSSSPIPAPHPPDSSEDEKPPILDFNAISGDLHMDQDRLEKEDYSLETSLPSIKYFSRDDAEMKIVDDDDLNSAVDMLDDVGEEREEEERKEGEREEGEREEEEHEEEEREKEEREVDMGCDVDVDVSGESSGADLDSGEENEDHTWTRDEDRIILHTIQAETDTEKTLSKLSSQLPSRTKDEVNVETALFTVWIRIRISSCQS